MGCCKCNSNSNVFVCETQGNVLILMYSCVRHKGTCVYAWVSLNTGHQTLHQVSSCHGVRLLCRQQLQEVWLILVGTHCLLETPDHHIQVRMTLLKVGLHDLSVSVRHVHNFLAVGMSPNLVLCIKNTTVVGTASFP